MRYTFIYILLFGLLIGCKSKPINQKLNKQREGLWTEQYTMDSSRYKSIGTYHKGDPIKKWRYYLNDKIIKKEKYKKTICKTKTYFENGVLESKGKTKIITNDLQTHWFYFGDWQYYNNNKKLIMIRKYSNGELLLEEKKGSNTKIKS